MNYLLNEKLNQKFPPFVNLGVLGFQFWRCRACSLPLHLPWQKIKRLSFPMYVHSIPNNNDNQDIVSMGCNAAINDKTVIDNSFEVLAIQMMTVLQAIDYLECVPTGFIQLNTSRIYRRLGKYFQSLLKINQSIKT